MADYKAPLRDMLFVLNELFEAEKFWASTPKTEEITGELASAILEEGAKLNEQVFFPLNRSGDEEGCRVEGTEVITPKGFKAAFKQLAEGGWTGLSGNPEWGGQGMPKMLTSLFEEMLFSSNTAFALYPILGFGACMALDKHATDELKRIYLQKMYAGDWAGTMCLTEPHCGTDLGMIRTKAEPQANGSYKISGTKIFITGGEHDLTENLIHLVLAKLPDAPAGSAGISLFLVPKFLVDAQGNLGERNPAFVGSIEHKMGIKGSATCVMNFDGAQGWLVGEVNRGLAAMFTMMNYERLTIGLQGLGSSEMAYQHAAAYAKERIQGRGAEGPVNPNKEADPIIIHADVRRMLLTIKANVEASRAFSMYVAQQLDITKFSEDKAACQRAESLVSLLTPVAKAYFSDRGLECCVLGQQVFGGHGYIREWGAEQLVRDVRIAQIYEGTNGIQALDLIGRKVVKSGGALLQPFVEDIHQCLAQLESVAELAPFAQGLTTALNWLQQATETVLAQAKQRPNFSNAVAVDYLDLFGLVALTFMWAKIAYVAQQKVNGAEKDYYQNKLQVGQFFLQKLLPRGTSLLATVQAGDEAIVNVALESF